MEVNNTQEEEKKEESQGSHDEDLSKISRRKNGLLNV